VVGVLRSAMNGSHEKPGLKSSSPIWVQLPQTNTRSIDTPTTTRAMSLATYVGLPPKRIEPINVHTTTRAKHMNATKHSHPKLKPRQCDTCGRVFGPLARKERTRCMYCTGEYKPGKQHDTQHSTPKEQRANQRPYNYKSKQHAKYKALPSKIQAAKPI